jgi:hypothetical protein
MEAKLKLTEKEMEGVANLAILQALADLRENAADRVHSLCRDRDDYGWGEEWVTTEEAIVEKVATKTDAEIVRLLTE